MMLHALPRASRRAIAVGLLLAAIAIVAAIVWWLLVSFVLDLDGRVASVEKRVSSLKGSLSIHFPPSFEHLPAVRLAPSMDGFQLHPPDNCTRAPKVIISPSSLSTDWYDLRCSLPSVKLRYSFLAQDSR